MQELDQLLADIADAVSGSRAFDDIDLCVDSISRITLLADTTTFGTVIGADARPGQR